MIYFKYTQVSRKIAAIPVLNIQNYHICFSLILFHMLKNIKTKKIYLFQHYLQISNNIGMNKYDVQMLINTI